MMTDDTPPTVSSRAVALLVEIRAAIGRMDRAPESDQYRKGWREGLAALTNSRAADELLAALEREGWQRPRTAWIAPEPPPAPPHPDHPEDAP